MEDYELSAIDCELNRKYYGVELDCTQIAKRAEYILIAYNNCKFEEVKKLLSSLHMWVNELNDDIFHDIIFTPKEVD